MKQIGIAFIWTMILATLLGLMAGWLLAELDYSFWIGPGFTVTLSLLDGWIQARSLLAKRLGAKNRPFVVQSNRMIPATFESILSIKRDGVEINDSIAIRISPSEVVPDEIVKAFVWKAYARHAAGKPAFSRRYWLINHKPRMERNVYEGLVEVLTSEGLIIGRVSGSSGKLALSYDDTIKRLRG